jgi:predicted Zn finger-like uncharacterized protein
MIEIQCTSCHTRYRIDERILPDDTPTFKCSRCNHVFSAEPRKQTPDETANAEASSAAGRPANRGSAAAVSPGEPRRGPSPSPDAEAASSAPAQPKRPAPRRREAQPGLQPESPRASAPAQPAEQAKPAQASSPTQEAEARRAAADVAAAAPAPREEPQPDRPAAGRRREAVAQEEPLPDAAGTDYERDEQFAASDQHLTSEELREAEDSTAHRHDTRELLQRRFSEVIAADAEKSGENLSFDFTDEPRSPDSSNRLAQENQWQVGDEEMSSARAGSRRRIRVSDFNDNVQRDPGMYSAIARRQRIERDDNDFDRIRPEEVNADAERLEAEFRRSAYKIHSAGYFIGLFAMVVLGFGIATITIQSAPLASAGLFSALPLVGQKFQTPVSAARRVALGDVQAQYLRLKNNQNALVVSGTAENLTSMPLGAVQIEAALTGSNSRPLRSQAVFCGNNLSPKMIGEMTPREIQFFERLDQPKNYTLAPQASAPFAIVFVDPPAGIGHFQVRVVRADAAPSPAPAAGNG